VRTDHSQLSIVHVGQRPTPPSWISGAWLRRYRKSWGRKRSFTGSAWLLEIDLVRATVRNAFQSLVAVEKTRREEKEGLTREQFDVLHVRLPA